MGVMKDWLFKASGEIHWPQRIYRRDGPPGASEKELYIMALNLSNLLKKPTN
jgi:hypothetical protein